MQNWIKTIVIENGAFVRRNHNIKNASRVALCHILGVRWLRSLGIVADHPNRLENEILIDVLAGKFSEVISCDYRRLQPLSGEFDLMIGFGKSARVNLKFSKIFVYYATGASALFQRLACKNEAEYLNGVGFSFIDDELRYPDSDDADIEKASGRILSIGNEWTKGTFGENACKVHSINAIPLLPPGFKYEKNDQGGVATRSLAWVGSKGYLHKGLHVAAVVAKRLGVKLNVLGIRRNSERKAYELLRSIGCDFDIYGWDKVGGERWMRVMNQSSVVIGASISEGMSTSLLTSAAYGLYPISFETCGVDIGSVLSDITIENRVDKLYAECDRILAFGHRGLKELRDDVAQTVLKDYTPEAYRQNFMSYMLNDLLGDA